MEKINRLLRQIACIPIYGYRALIKPLLRPCCRFYPSCSAYAIEAIQHCGLLKGSLLTTMRLLRCHPWGGDGYDPLLKKEKF